MYKKLLDTCGKLLGIWLFLSRQGARPHTIKTLPIMHLFHVSLVWSLKYIAAGEPLLSTGLCTASNRWVGSYVARERWVGSGRELLAYWFHVCTVLSV